MEAIQTLQNGLCKGFLDLAPKNKRPKRDEEEKVEKEKDLDGEQAKKKFPRAQTPASQHLMLVMQWCQLMVMLVSHQMGGQLMQMLICSRQNGCLLGDQSQQHVTLRRKHMFAR